MQRFFSGWITQRMPVLQKADAQHPVDADRLAPGAAGFRIMRFDQIMQALPGHDLFDFFQELLLARAHRVFLKPAEACKGGLPGHG